MRVVAWVSLLMAGSVAAQDIKPPVTQSTSTLPQDRVDKLMAQAARAGAETAVTPLQVQAVDPAFVGKLLLTRNPISPPSIATQGLMPLGAARALLGKDERTMPLTIIGRVATGEPIPSDPSRRAYCNAHEERGDAIRCYVDVDGDGRFDTARWGQTYSDDSPYTLYMVNKAEPLATPIAYAKVEPKELPALQLIYQGCRVTDRIQYSAKIGVRGDGDVKTFGCPSAAQPIGKTELVGPGRYRVDRVTVDVAEVNATNGEAATRIIEPIPAGTLLDRIDKGRPVRLLGERRGWPIEQAELRQRYEAPPYRFVGVPYVTASGGVASPIVSGPYQYGYTARIIDGAMKSVMFSGKKIAFEPGDALYGIPMQDPLAPQLFGEPMMMWCAPKEKKPGDWRASCLQQAEVTRGVYDGVFGALWIEQIPAIASNSDAIEIAEGPAELPKPSVRYDFVKWTPKRLILRAVVSHDGKDAAGWRQVEAARLADGSALLGIAGGVIRVTPDAAGTGWQATTIRPLEANASAQQKSGFLVALLSTAKKDGRPLSVEEQAEALDEGSLSDVRTGVVGN
jgi:hypothetical protein